MVPHVIACWSGVGVRMPAGAEAAREAADAAAAGASETTVCEASERVRPRPHCVQDCRDSGLDAPQLGQTMSGYLGNRINVNMHYAPSQSPGANAFGLCQAGSGSAPHGEQCPERKSDAG